MGNGGMSIIYEWSVSDFLVDRKRNGEGKTKFKSCCANTPLCMTIVALTLEESHWSMRPFAIHDIEQRYP